MRRRKKIKLATAIFNGLKKIELLRPEEINFGWVDYLDDIIKKYYREQEPKHEEIKKMAFEIYSNNFFEFTEMKHTLDKNIAATKFAFNSAWDMAEAFYLMTKQKEQEGEE